MFILFFIAFVALIIYILLLISKSKVKTIEKIIGILYFISIVLFGINMLNHTLPYSTAIDPIDNEDCYTPFANDYLLTLQIYFLLFNVSVIVIWKKGINLPPVILVLGLVFIVIGLIINLGIIFQVSYHNIESLNRYNGQEETFLFLAAPLLSFVIGICLIVRVVKKRAEITIQANYSNKILNSINKILGQIVM